MKNSNNWQWAFWLWSICSKLHNQACQKFRKRLRDCQVNKHGKCLIRKNENECKCILILPVLTFIYLFLQTSAFFNTLDAGLLKIITFLLSHRSNEYKTQENNFALCFKLIFITFSAVVHMFCRCEVIVLHYWSSTHSCASHWHAVKDTLKILHKIRS